jgi:hypothetical protein
MLQTVNAALASNGRERSDLPAAPSDFAFITPVQLSSGTAVDPVPMVHYSSDAVFELTIRMLLFFPPEELLAMFQHGITPTVLTVPVAYVGS